MHLHLVQTESGKIECHLLMSVNKQIITPQTSKPIVAIFQDSLVGGSKLSDKDVFIGKGEMMQFLGMAMYWNRWCLPPAAVKQYNPTTGAWEQWWTGKQLISEIMPALHLTHLPQVDQHSSCMNALDTKSITKLLHDQMMVIIQGKVLCGRFDSKMIGKSANGVIHNLVHDFGDTHTANFLSDFQRVTNSWLKTYGISIGMSDCVAPVAEEVQNVIEKVVSEMQREPLLQKHDTDTALICQKKEALKVNLLNTLRSHAGFMIKKQLASTRLCHNNRLQDLVEAGSKGSWVNITQIVGTLGQTMIDGRRISKPFAGRSLPFFTRDSNSLQSSGWISRPFVAGLTPVEFYYHAQGGREGVISTAISTADTGYLQRRMTKGTESESVRYDWTVRDAPGNIVDFAYGGDNVDGSMLMKHALPLLAMRDECLEEELGHRRTDWSMWVSLGSLPHSDQEWKHQQVRLARELVCLKQDRDTIRTFRLAFPGDTCENEVMVPVNIKGIIATHKSEERLNHMEQSLTDLSPTYAIDTMEAFLSSLYRIFNTPQNRNVNFEAVIRFNLCTRQSIGRLRLRKQTFDNILQSILKKYHYHLISPGEAVGSIAAQSLGEPATQATLNQFHLAGIGSHESENVGSIKKTVDMAKDQTTASMTVYVKPAYHSQVKRLQHQLECKKLLVLVDKCQLVDEVSHLGVRSTTVQEDQPWVDAYFSMFEEDEMNQFCIMPHVIRLVLKQELLAVYGASVHQIVEKLRHAYTYQDGHLWAYDEPKAVIRLYLSKSSKTCVNYQKRYKDSIGDDLRRMVGFVASDIIRDTTVYGIDGISATNIGKQRVTQPNPKTGQLEPVDVPVIFTKGSNILQTMSLPFVDARWTTTNSFREINDVFGIQATHNAVYRTINKILKFGGMTVIPRHPSIIVRTMTHRGTVMALQRHNMKSLRDIGTLQKAGFEEAMEVLTDAAFRGDVDPLKDVTGAIIVGNRAPVGTGCMDVVALHASQPEEVSRYNDQLLKEKTMTRLSDIDVKYFTRGSNNPGQQHILHKWHGMTPSATLSNELISSDTASLQYGNDVAAGLIPMHTSLGIHLSSSNGQPFVTGYSPNPDLMIMSPSVTSMTPADVHATSGAVDAGEDMNRSFFAQFQRKRQLYGEPKSRSVSRKRNKPQPQAPDVVIAKSGGTGPTSIQGALKAHSDSDPLQLDSEFHTFSYDARVSPDTVPTSDKQLNTTQVQTPW